MVFVALESLEAEDGLLVEQVHSDGCGDEVGLVVVDGHPFLEVEFGTNEFLVVLGHVAEAETHNLVLMVVGKWHS